MTQKSHFKVNNQKKLKLYVKEVSAYNMVTVKLFIRTKIWNSKFDTYFILNVSCF